MATTEENIPKELQFTPKRLDLDELPHGYEVNEELYGHKDELVCAYAALIENYFSHFQDQCYNGNFCHIGGEFEAIKPILARFAELVKS